MDLIDDTSAARIVAELAQLDSERITAVNRQFDLIRQMVASSPGRFVGLGMGAEGSGELAIEIGDERSLLRMAMSYAGGPRFIVTHSGSVPFDVEATIGEPLMVKEVAGRLAIVSRKMGSLVGLTLDLIVVRLMEGVVAYERRRAEGTP